MATKDISDRQVCFAYLQCQDLNDTWPYQLLQQTTGQAEKVCYRAMERAARRDLINYGVSLRSGWLTEKGEALLRGN